MVDTVSEYADSTHTHLTCFDQFDMAHDVFELRHGGGKNSMEISVNLINQGELTKLYFGENANLTSIAVAGSNLACQVNKEATDVIRIQNGTVIESECVGK